MLAGGGTASPSLFFVAGWLCYAGCAQLGLPCSLRPPVCRALRDKAAATYHIGSLVTGVDLRTDGVTITLEDGSQHEGDLLVGADGAGSVVRTLLLPEARSTYTRAPGCLRHVMP